MFDILGLPNWVAVLTSSVHRRAISGQPLGMWITKTLNSDFGDQGYRTKSQVPGHIEKKMQCELT